MGNEINGYSLSRNWFDWCFENPERHKPSHTALYFFCVEQCNRLGWKEKFGLPTAVAMEAIGLRSYGTYIKTLNDLLVFGFITLIEKSKNQFTCNIIALTKFDIAKNKALDKAIIKQIPKQSDSADESICSINKQVTNNEKKINIKNNKQNLSENKFSAFKECMIIYNEFIFRETGVVAKINGRTGKSLNKIIDFINQNWKHKNPESEISENEIVKSFNFLFENYNKWDMFYQGQKELHQIESNLVNIISSIIKPKQKTQVDAMNDFLK